MINRMAQLVNNHIVGQMRRYSHKIKRQRYIIIRRTRPPFGSRCTDCHTAISETELSGKKLYPLRQNSLGTQAQLLNLRRSENRSYNTLRSHTFAGCLDPLALGLQKLQSTAQRHRTGKRQPHLSRRSHGYRHTARTAALRQCNVAKSRMFIYVLHTNC